LSLSGSRTFVGFGFGAIQTGLFLYEAGRSGAFGRLVVAEVVPQVVESVRASDGFFDVNIARPDGVDSARVGPVELANPSVEADRTQIVDAIATADEIATAVPSVDFYSSGDDEASRVASLDRVLADGLCEKVRRGGPPAVVYAAENNNHAAEILEERVLDCIPEVERAAVQAQVCFVNTVIGKMSGVVADPQEISGRQLRTVTPSDSRALLVEEFNRILISRIEFGDAGVEFERRLKVFEEKDDLLPFEEAKLFGHNATHALGAYIGAVRGVERIDELRDLSGVMPFLRAAFIEESGASLVDKYAGVDALFTHVGYQRYTDDLLSRMTNPHLGDLIERVARDPRRKLGWSDRLVGTVRLALQQGNVAPRYALGAAAALESLQSGENDAVRNGLRDVWNGTDRDAREETAVLDQIEEGAARLHEWRESGFGDLELVFS